MKILSKFNLLIVASVALMMAPLSVGAISPNADVQRGSGASNVSEVKAPTGIVSLRMRINSDGRITLLSKDIVEGRWQDNRNIPVGPRLYYEVVDRNGTVIAKGFRRDPRYMHDSRYEDFLLTTPYTADSVSVNVYMVDYENGGRGGYSRDFSLLASVDVRQTVTASIQ